MKVNQIKAYKSEDGAIWESEEEAINQNIEDCICSLNHNCGANGSDIYTDIKKWFRDHPKDIKYILANINKIKNHIE